MDKPFDCIEMKRQGQRAVRNRLKSMTRAQQLDYWQQRFREMLTRQQQHRAGIPPVPAR